MAKSKCCEISDRHNYWERCYGNRERVGHGGSVQSVQEILEHRLVHAVHGLLNDAGHEHQEPGSQSVDREDRYFRSGPRHDHLSQPARPSSEGRERQLDRDRFQVCRVTQTTANCLACHLDTVLYRK